MAKTAVLLLAPGAEEIESVVPIDILRRGGIKVTVAGVAGPDTVLCSRDVVIEPEVGIKDVVNESFDVVILPGGMPGTKYLKESEDVAAMVQKQDKEQKLVAAICAAPIVLKANGIGPGKKVTSYPSFKAELTEDSFYEYSEEKVVVDGNLITSRGPGTAFDFALTILEQLAGEDVKNKVQAGLLYHS